MKADIKTIPELETAIENLLKKHQEDLKADVITFHYFDKPYDRLILPVGVNLHDQHRFKAWLPSMDRIAGQIIKTCQPVIADDAEHHPDTTGPFVYAEGIKSSAGYPLVTKTKQKIGILFVNYRDAHSFFQEEVALLDRTTNGIANTIEGWLEKSPDLRIKLSALAGRRREEAALQEIADTVRKVLGNVAVAIWIPGHKGDELIIVAQSGLMEQVTKEARLSLTKSCSVIDAYQSKNRKIGNVLDEEIFPNELVQTMRLNVVVAYPILSLNRSLGVLCVYPITFDMLTPREEIIIDAWVKQAAATIENQRNILTLTTINDMGRRLTSTLVDPQILMEDIVNNAARVMDADSVSLHQYNPELQEFYNYDKSVTFGIETYPPDKKPRAGGVSEYIVNHGLIRINDLDKAATRFVRATNIVAEGVKSYMGIRLKADEDVVGVLFINYNEKREFSPDDVTIATTLANYAAIAIRNARQFQQLSEMMGRMSTRIQSLYRIAQERDINKVLARIMESINSILGEGTSSSINLYDETTDRFFSYQAAGDIKSYLLEVPPRPNGTGRFVVSTRGPLYLNDVLSPPEGCPTIRQESIDMGVRSFAALPLIRDNTIIALLFINSNNPLVFSEGIKGVLDIFASQAAIDIENSQLYEQLNLRINDLAAVIALGQKLSSEIHLDESEILRLIHEQASELMDTDNMYIALYDAATEMIRFGLMYIDGKWKEQPTRKFGKEGVGKTEWIIENKKPIFHATKSEALIWYELPGHKEYGTPLGSWVGVPMQIGDRVLGVIATYHPTKDYVYSEGDREILQAMANQAAVAIENARLYEQEKEAQTKIVEREAILNRTSFAADFVHRLNNLAGTIPGWVDMIRDHLRIHEKADIHLDEYLNYIEDEADHLLREAERLKAPPQEDNVNLEVLLESLVRQSQVQMPDTVDIKLNVLPPLININAVRSELADSFWNIIENGLEAMEYQGDLVVEAKMTESNRWCEIRITDAGPGIPDEQKEIVFKPFVSTKDDHSGYGLWRAKYVIESLGGSIEFTKNEPLGTTFIIKLPNITKGSIDEN